MATASPLNLMDSCQLQPTSGMTADQSAPVVEVKFEHSANLAYLLNELSASLVLTTYQAGRVITIGTSNNQIEIRFAHISQAMGLTRTPTGLAIGSLQGVWTFPASLDLGPNLHPAGKNDVAFLARNFHRTGPILGHELAWCAGRLWLVNTLFNCLCTVEEPWSFVPQWRPSFINTITAEDRCHLNGLAIDSGSARPTFVTAHGSTNSANGWRHNKAHGGCLIAVDSGEIVVDTLSMPHSPRIHLDKLFLLNSGRGELLHCSPSNGSTDLVCQLPGFTRGLDFHGPVAAIGLSRIRETASFGGLPIREQGDKLHCGVAFVELSTGRRLAHLWFQSGVEEIFAVAFMPGYLNPAIIGPSVTDDGDKEVWLVPNNGCGSKTLFSNLSIP